MAKDKLITVRVTEDIRNSFNVWCESQGLQSSTFLLKFIQSCIDGKIQPESFQDNDKLTELEDKVNSLTEAVKKFEDMEARLYNKLLNELSHNKYSMTTQKIDNLREYPMTTQKVDEVSEYPMTTQEIDNGKKDIDNEKLVVSEDNRTEDTGNEVNKDVNESEDVSHQQAETLPDKANLEGQKLPEDYPSDKVKQIILSIPAGEEFKSFTRLGKKLGMEKVVNARNFTYRNLQFTQWFPHHFLAEKNGDKRYIITKK